MNEYYVTLQDGVIKENPASFTNYYEFKVVLDEEEKETFQEILDTKEINEQYEFLYHVCVNKSDKRDIKKMLGYTPK